MGRNTQALYFEEKDGDDVYAYFYDHLGLVIRKNKKEIYNEMKPNESVRSRFFKSEPGKIWKLELLDKFDREQEMEKYMQWRKENLSEDEQKWFEC